VRKTLLQRIQIAWRLLCNRRHEIYSWINEDIKFEGEEVAEVRSFFEKAVGQKLLLFLEKEVMLKQALAIRQADSDKSLYMGGVAFGFDSCYSILRGFLKAISPETEPAGPPSLGARLRL
jgi:hypothetical protein